MEFYEQLTKLLSQYNEIEQIENQKKIDQSQKEKNYKKFIERLLSFNKCKNETEESKSFKLYYIEYLKDYIENSISFCSPDEKKAIEILINNDSYSQEKNKIDNENIYNFKNNNINDNSFNDYEILKSNYSNMENNNNINIDNSNLNLKFDKNVKEYVPKKYRNKENYNNNNNINIHQNINLNLLNDNNNNNYVNSNHNDFNNFHHNVFNQNNSDEINNKNNQIFIEKKKNNINFNKIQENKENNISKKNIKNGKENEINQINANQIQNNNKLNDNNNNNQIKFDQNIFKEIENNLPFGNKFNNNIQNNFINNGINDKLDNGNDKNNDNNNNKIIENHSKEEKPNYCENKYNKNNLLIKADSDLSSLSTHSNNTNNFENNNYSDGLSDNKANDISKTFKNNKPKKNNNNQKNGNVFANPAEKYEKEIDNYYEKFFNQNFSESIINFIIKNNKFNEICAKIFSLVNHNKIEYIKQEQKEKLITLLCALYPFSKGQKSKIGNDEIFKANKIDKILIKYLRTNILMLNDSKNIFSFNQKKVESFLKDFYVNLSLPQSNGKNYLFCLYTFFVIARNIRNNCKNYNDKSIFDKLLEKEYIISFKIHFILEHQEFYNSISDDFIEIYNGLFFIKVFYDGIFMENESNENKLIKRENDIYVFGKDKFVLPNYNYNFDINSLFLAKDNEIYAEVMKKIEYFYQIDKYNSNCINDLIYYSSNKYGNNESNFLLNLVEHETEKINYIYNNFNAYKNNLIKIEEQIYKFGKETLNLKEENGSKSFFRYTINEDQKKVFQDLLYQINCKISWKYKGKFQLYPYGSVTQFLGGQSSDIDIYLDINNIGNKDDKIDFFSDLEKLIKKISYGNVNTIISTRLCVIKFKYRTDYSITDFDISLMGFCPYLHSVLLRTYSLMDSRFPLLAITIKKFIELINIKSLDNKQEYLNSFSWMILLITFLQDIIKPRILPKILSHPNISIANYPIQYGQNVGRGYNKFIVSFINNIKEENTMLPETLSNSKISFQLYEEEIKNKEEKNNLSCSEIFLQFLEFIIYYFKSDSVYVNCSIENEGYESMYNILNYYDSKIEVNRIDSRFSEYFKNKYCKARNYEDKKKTRDGLILIRDPLDPHYNPAQSLRVGCYKTFIENIKFGYLNLLKYGDFYRLKRELKQKNENNK